MSNNPTEEEANIKVANAIKELGLKPPMSDERLSECIDKLIADSKDNRTFDLYKDSRSRINALMGKAMALYRHEADGEKVYKMLEKKLLSELEV
jgi:Asp-tRNA(Asn)/Glu-tRNA(Gln) amidotransferase B subunit